ncbi:hypothetical protein ACOMHN_030246 [Nucella lapillus]
MKTVQSVGQCTVAVWLLCMVTGSTCAVFYTLSRNNNYPRIGKRAFFTRGDKGSIYPRIGRSSSGPEGNAAMIGNVAGFRSLPKRSSLRMGGSDDLGGLELSAPSALVTSLEDPDVEKSDESSWLPLGLLFFSFDKDGDKQLSRQEFAQGMINAREMGPKCRR